MRSLIRGGEAVADINFVLNYYRPSRDNRLLFGGRVSYSGVDPLSIGSTVRRTMLEVFPQLGDAEITHAWGGQVAITVNRLPHLGRLAPNVLFAQGYSGHGVALAPFAGTVLAEAIAGQAGRFDVFTHLPHTPFPGGTALRTPLLVLAAVWYKLKDRL
jgi:gamma-glutamylputrescine oxidase